MAENEITYIPYGQDEISQQDLMTSLANGVESYLGSKRWARKDKYRQAWLNAYQDIINSGLTGASNENGIWTVNQKNSIDLNSKSNAEREMYQDAAYYIQQKMAQMTPRKKEEEKKKEDLEKYGNFGTNLMNRILKRYGNNSELFKDSEQGWDAQDVRGANGLRGTEKRRAAMIAELEAYKKDLDNQDLNYNFEGTSFKDKADLQTKIQTAIDALKNTPEDESDDLPAFSALGLPYRAFFNNGGNDIYSTTDDGKQVTYKQYYENQQKAAQEKIAAEAKAKKQAAYNNTLFINRVTSSKMLGQNAQALKAKYGDHNSLFAALQGYSQKDIRTLSPEEQSEVQGIYRYLAKDPIDNNLLKQLQGSSSGLYKNSAPNRFRKIKGIDNLIWDNVAGQVIQINNRQQQQALQNQPTDLFKGIQTQQDIQSNYMNSTEGGFTPAEQREVAALLFDLGAAVDPEGVSSAGLSQIAAGIRDYNRASDPEGWTWGDTGWATLDHGLGLLSAIPVVGGLVKGSWAAAKLGSYIPKMEKWIRLAGRAGSTYAMAANASGALNTLNKIKNGEDLSLKDYQDLAYFFIGGLGHHQLNRGNRVERSAMKARGIETSNSLLNKAGITRTKAKTTNTSETTPTLKVQKTGENGKVETKEIPIDKEKQKILSKTKAEDLETKAKELKIEIPEGYKIQPKSTTTKTWSRENLNRYRGKAHSEIFGTQTSQKQTQGLKSDEEFEQYLSEHNNTWLKKFFNGSNHDIRRYDRYLGNNQISKPSEETPKTTSEQKQSSTPKVSKENIKTLRENEEFKQYRDLMDYKKKDSSRGVLKDGTEHTVEFGGKSYNFKYDGKTHSITINGKQIKIDPEKGMEGVRKEVSKFIQQQRKTTINSKKITKEEQKEIVAKLKELKKKGFLKQGGTLNPYIDNVIEDFLKNNNI